MIVESLPDLDQEFTWMYWSFLITFKQLAIDFQVAQSFHFLFSLFLLQNFAKEFMFNDLKELDEENIRNELKKAGGANYDAQAE